MVALRQNAPPVQAAVWRVVAAVKVSAPAPLFRPDDERRGINGFDLRREVDHAVLDLVHRCPGWTDVPVGGVPETRFVVEDVVAQTAGCIRSPASDKVLHPTLLERRIRWHVRVVRIVAGDEAAGCAYAVARVRKPLPVVSALCAVLRD